MYKHITNILMSIILIMLIAVLFITQNEEEKHEHIHTHDGRYLNIDDNLKLFSVVDKYNELLKYTIYLESRLTTLESKLNIDIPENTKTNPPQKID